MRQPRRQPKPERRKDTSVSRYDLFSSYDALLPKQTEAEIYSRAVLAYDESRSR
jgi:DNA polymerase/3'-5' exonuclease PolX